MMLFTLALLACLVLPFVIIAAVGLYRDPVHRLRAGRVLLSEKDASCVLCGREHAGLLIRTRWLEDMPACDGCLTRVHGASPTIPESPPRLVLLRRALEDEVPPGKPMPKF